MPRRNAFADSYAKLKRAEELLQALHEEIQAFESSRPLVLEAELDPEPPKQGSHLIRVHCDNSYLVGLRMERLGILAGEVVHHLRSALNHLVWNLIQQEGKGPTKQTEFPIFKSRPQYEADAPRKIKGVPDKSLSLFFSVQPFNGNRTADPLWQVHTLDIRDKHHVLLVTTGVLPVRLEEEEEGPLDKFYDLIDGETIKGLWTSTPVGRRIDAWVIIALAEEPGDRMTLEMRLMDCLEGTESVINRFREIL